MITILITTSSFGKNDPTPLKALQEAGLSVITNPFGRKLTEDEVGQLITEHQPTALIAGIEPLTRRVQEKSSGLGVISRCGIGKDSVDLGAAKELGITVTNTPDAPTIPVAELTMGMILCMLRHLHTGDRAIRQGQWQRPMGNLLHQKTLGVLGCGRIGSMVASLATAFGCRILGCDPCIEEHDCCDMSHFDEIISQSDIISIHVPYSESCHHLLGQAEIKRMKPGAIIINTSRGGLVDEESLYHALKENRLGGAALDCYEEEPYSGPLRELDNVLLTAHIGSYALEGRLMMEQQSVDNLFRELKKLKVIQ
ncbi:MAG: phosphoglycerate dehydrogenase [Thermodesulfobacteriota bacterium]